ncbi:MAG: bifunctional hydroxymethylpyrimidine kinase/phosphomethylpyrimidine kinase [Streptosporangiales bacterium]|nr:bifunctional hydroxymethylpyrimidine kinase/phosphomethylpyrimidine kinase [Streptosporangiales bacterium]MBO0890211.1 bifunctional hydroxymethylpyrimidine kinase/phosphomethylpyrimidine kinase [Acidothermales bacterium]
MIPNILTIAGTDPTGGAGIQADLKTFSALGGYGMSVVTALVAQNTRGVDRVFDVPADFVRAQLDSVFADARVDAVKIGMLGDVDVIKTVAGALDDHSPPHVVLDPVMVAKSGDRLLRPDAVATLRDVLVPRASLITPNLPEAADLLGEPEATTADAMAAQLHRLGVLGVSRILLKGGHLRGEHSTDLLLADGTVHRFDAERVDTVNTHGTGCTLSSAIATLRPQRGDWLTAVSEAKAYLTGTLRHADELDVGGGHGPVHHFHELWER